MVTAARALVGTAFRPHGRDAARGLDCVGLVISVARAVGQEAAEKPYHYSGSHSHLPGLLRANGLVVCPAGPGCNVVPGQVLVFAVDAARCHLAIAAQGAGGITMIHAHAGLRKVVEQQMAVPWLDRLIHLACFPHHPD